MDNSNSDEDTDADFDTQLIIQQSLLDIYKPGVTQHTSEDKRSHSISSADHKKIVEAIKTYPSTLEKMMGSEETPHGVYFHCVQCEPLVKKVPLPQQSAVLIRQAGHKRVTVKHCQDEEGQPLRISYFTEKSVRCARPTGYGWMPQHCRGTLGKEDALAHLTKYHSAFDEANGDGWLPLHMAAVQLNRNILEITLNATKPNMWEQTTHNGETPLFLAVSSSLLENAHFLLLNGCNPNAKNLEGNSPLFTAVLKDSYDMATLLISHGADVNMRCANKRTALHEAAKLGNWDIVKLMLTSGAHPDARSSYGFTPLALAAQGGHTEIMELLLQKGADVHSQASDSSSILLEAVRGGNPDSVTLLLEYGADANIPKSSGHLPIHVAADKGHLLALKMLVPVTDIAAIKRSGISPVHCAAAGAHPQCLEILIQAGFDVNFMLDQRVRKHYDDQRKSALYFAVSNGDLSSVKLLLNAGALPNQDPVNCLQIALRMGNHELISLLLRHGANVNYFCRVNPLHFPSALQYSLKDEVMLRMLLNYGYDTERCFDCPHGDRVHRFCTFEGWTPTVIKDTMFCEVITLSWLQHLSGKVVRVLLDYVDQVQICSKLKAVLEKQKLWPEIHLILTNPRSLKHLCRLKIRKCMGRLRLRCPVFMSFLPLPNRLKAYVLYKEYDLYGQESFSGTW